MAGEISINLDIRKDFNTVIKCKQNDDLPLEVNLFANGEPVDLTNKEIIINGTKDDNTYVKQNTGITKKNNIFNVDYLDRDFTRVPGTTKTEVVLLENGKQDTTFTFYLAIQASVLKGAVQSSNKVTILEELDNKTELARQVKEETEQLIENGNAATKGEVKEINASLEQNMKQMLGANSVYEIDIKSMQIKDLGEILSIPSYIGNEVVHPSILYMPNSWNGYKYWLAFTPYQNSDNQVENPSIVCSNNGSDWIIPIGVTNPLVPTPVTVGKAVGSYNSDVMLFMDKDNVTMHIVYRECFGYSENQGDERLYLISSTDGWKTVTEPKAILINKSSVSRPVCPAIRWNGEEYLLWYVDIVPTQRKIYLRKSKTLDNWSEAIELSIYDNSKVNPWHYDINYYNGYYYMLMQGGGSAGGDLFLAKSINGIDWTANNNKINLVNKDWNNKPYKGTILPINSEDGFKFGLWLSSIGNLGWKTGYIDIKSDNVITQNTIENIADLRVLEYKKQNQMLYAVNKIPPYLFADNFNRITTDGLGASTTGQVWKNDTSYFIANNGVATPKVNGNCRSYVDVNNSNVSVSFEIKNYSGQLWIIGRMLNLLNYVRVGIRDNTIIAENIISGVATSLGSVGYTFSANDTFEVQFNGTTISAYINGIKKLEVTSSVNQNSTMVGIQANNTSIQISNFVVSYLGEIKGSFVDDIVNKRISETVGTLLAINKIYPYVIGDNFNRTDNTTGLGTAPSGQSWSNNSGVMAIKNGKASPNADVNTRAIIDSTVANGRIATRISALDTQAFIVFRLLDGSNFLRVGYINSSQIELQKIEGGVSTVLGYKSSLIYTANDLLEVEYSGSTISVFLNGDKIIASSSTFNQSSTSIGLQATKVGTLFDDFTFKTL